MTNMPYCRFENTYNDLLDCYDNMDKEDISSSESVFRRKLITLAHKIGYYYNG